MKISYLLHPYKYFLLLVFSVIFSCNEASDRKSDEESKNKAQLDVQPPKEITENEFWVKVENMDCYILTNSDKGPYNWTGGCADFKINGKGVLTAEGHYVLSGTAKEGVIEGFGEIDVSSEELGLYRYSYKGNFQGNWLFGEGEMLMSNGDKSKGFFKWSKLSDGVMSKVNGESFYFIKGDTVSRDSYMVFQEKVNGFVWPELNTPLIYYYDAEWNITDATRAKYYRKVEMISKYKAKDNYIQDYYIDGTPQNLFYADYIDLSRKLFHYQGENTRFDEKGHLVNDDNYINNLTVSSKQDDIVYTRDVHGNVNWAFYENDELIELQESKAGNNMVTVSHFDIDGRLSMKGHYVKLPEQTNITPASYVDYFKPEGLVERLHNVNFQYLGWPIDNESFEYEKTAQSLKIKNKTSNKYLTAFHTKFFDLNLDNDFIIDLRAKENYDNQIVLSWGQDRNTSTSFYFYRGQYQLKRLFEGVKVDETAWKKNSSIKRMGFNTYKIIKLSEKLLLSVNGEIIQSFTDFSVDSNFIGFQAWGEETNIDYFSIKEFIKNNDLSSEPDPNDIPEEDETWKGSGSGFILTSDGYIVTNHHVIDKARSIEVTITNEDGINDYSAELIKSDESIDLAILKINDPKFPSDIEITNGIRSSGVRVGEEVFALGYPLTFIMGEEVKFTDGRISSLTGFQGDIKSFQTSIPIQPGNSGGPMLDYDGNLIGIMTSILNKEVAENVSYSVKANNLMSLIEVLSFDIELPGAVKSQDRLPDLIDRITNQTVFIKVK